MNAFNTMNAAQHHEFRYIILPVDEGPSEIVDGVLLVFDGFGDDFGVEVIVEAVIEMRLDRQRLVKELLEEVLLGGLAENHAFAVGILVRATRAAAHLQRINLC